MYEMHPLIFFRWLYRPFLYSHINKDTLQHINFFSIMSIASIIRSGIQNKTNRIVINDQLLIP